MIKQYLDELKTMKEKMEKAEKLANKLPLFKEKILENKITGEDYYVKLADRYKEISLAWGINRGFYESGTKKTMTNCREAYSGYFFNVYINSLSLFNEHNNFGLSESMVDVDVFFFDTMNTTFYITDENISDFLEALNDWYIKARDNLKTYKKEQRKIKLKEELIELETPMFETKKE